MQIAVTSLSSKPRGNSAKRPTHRTQLHIHTPISVTRSGLLTGVLAVAAALILTASSAATSRHALALPLRACATGQNFTEASPKLIVEKPNCLQAIERNFGAPCALRTYTRTFICP